MTNRPKIFISAYACEPNLGSEIGVGWHWVLEMSKYFNLWVLTRKSNQKNIENWLKENPLENTPHFIYFDLPPKLRFWKKGLKGVRLYYLLWQNLTDKLVRQTMEENGISVYHLLTYGNAFWPASRYGQKQVFIWGPTSVGSYIPSKFSKYYGAENQLKEAFQRFMSQTLNFNIGFKKRCRDSRLILCKTEHTLRSIPVHYRNKAIVFTDVAVQLFDTSKFQRKVFGNCINYLAVGRLESWRGFDLLIEAFAGAVKHNSNLHLDILGDGNDKGRLSFLITKFRMTNHIVLAGHVSMDEYYQFMANCDVIVNPALKEGAVTTAFDSMSFAKPLICINTGGYTRYFSTDYAIVLDMQSRDSLITNLSSAILRLTDDKLRKCLSDKIMDIRNQFTWEEKGRQIRDVILKNIE